MIDSDKQAYATIWQTFNFNNNQLFQEQNNYTLEIYKAKQNANNLYLLVEILSNSYNNFNAPNSALISNFYSNLSWSFLISIICSNSYNLERLSMII